MANPPRISPDGIALLKAHESFEPEAYPDPGSPLGQACARLNLPMRKYRIVLDWESRPGDPWTIGYGHTGDVDPGDRCTQEQAEAWLAADLHRAETAVAVHVQVPLTTFQRDALISFTYNVGVGAFRTSTLLKLLNMGDYAGAAEQFPRWNKAQGRALNGLTARRADERDLFLTA